MFKRVVVALAIVLMLSLFWSSDHPAASSPDPAQLPSIRACTRSEMLTIAVFVENAGGEIDALNAAMDADDLDSMYTLAWSLHKNWFEESPDIPYCAQGVHVRLLMDRAIEAFTLAAITMYYGDLELALDYADMMTIAGQDLITYGEILSAYQ